MKCTKCNSTKNIQKQVGPHIGIYCADCNKWLKWQAKPKPVKASEYKDNITWQPPEAGWSKPVFGRRHNR